MPRRNRNARQSRRYNRNWFSKKRKARLLEMQKRTPSFLYKKEEGELSKEQLKIKGKLNTEKHWFSGMVRESTGRSNLKSDLHSIKQSYNYISMHDELKTGVVLSGLPVVDIVSCSCLDCQQGTPVIEASLLTSYDVVDHVDKFDELSSKVKSVYEKWEYKY